MDGKTAMRRVLDWLGRDLTATQWERLEVLEGWLIREAQPAGGLGPAEHDRIWTRHLADSMLFSVGIGDDTRSLIDVGTGVGLPALPLAIAWPTVSIVALDRRERRIDLVRRACHILKLENVEAHTGDVSSWRGTHDAATFRGVGTVSRVTRWASRLLEPRGVGIMAVSRSGSAPAGVDMTALSTTVVRIPSDLLDSPVTLLRMERRVDS